MKQPNIYKKQWISFFIVLLIAIASTAFILYRIPLTTTQDQFFWISAVIISALFLIHLANSYYLKNAEKQLASALSDNLTPPVELPLLAFTIQQKQALIDKDVETFRHINAELTVKASLDNLTNLQNRSAFRKELNDFLQKESTAEQACLCLIRATELTTINRHRGRIAGDQYLLALAEIIRYVGKKFATTHLYRLSSSDYAILIFNSQASVAPILGKELKQLFDNFQLQMTMDSVAYSGITFLSPGEQPEQPLCRADLALAKAQTSGTNGWFIQADDANDAFQGESHWQETIRFIINSGNIGFVGQSILPLNMAIHNYTQIIPRFAGHNKQLIPYDTVYAMAMRHGLMDKLEKLVIEGALRQKKRNPEQAARWGMNLSANALFDTSFMNWLEQLLIREQETAPGFVFEIDEEILECHLPASIRMFEMLRRVGSRSCISKFGRGLGSFRLYRELRPDYIKLDSDLTDTLQHDGASQQFIRMIIEISHRLGCMVIAGGVESMVQREMLEHMYVDAIQGQLVSKTISID